jgi:YfiH family protein
MAFLEKKKGNLLCLISDKIKTNHAFTTRFGGVSSGGFSSLNFGYMRGDPDSNVNENFRILGEAFDINPFKAGFTRQVHGSDVRLIKEQDLRAPSDFNRPDCDAVVTSLVATPIFCFVADCAPILLLDDENKVAAAIHCGWRSSVADILKNTLELMKEQGAQLQNITAAIGPSIGQCCYEVGEEVAAALERYISSGLERVLQAGAREGRYHADLKLANAIRLTELGVLRDKIDICEECTKCEHDKFWSHRHVGLNDRGSQCAFISIE